MNSLNAAQLTSPTRTTSEILFELRLHKLKAINVQKTSFLRKSDVASWTSSRRAAPCNGGNREEALLGAVVVDGEDDGHVPTDVESAATT